MSLVDKARALKRDRHFSYYESDNVEMRNLPHAPMKAESKLIRQLRAMRKMTEKELRAIKSVRRQLAKAHPRIAGEKNPGYWIRQVLRVFAYQTLKDKGIWINHPTALNVVNDALAKQRTFEILSSQISHLPFKTTLREIRWAIDENSRTTR